MESYNELAGYIGTFPTMAIFRRFLPLNARNLLCMQAELIHLEDDLRIIIEDDRSAEGRTAFESNIAALKGPHHKPGDEIQWEKWLEARRLLKDYNEAVLQFAALCNLPPANKLDLSNFRKLLLRTDGSGETFLKSYEKFTWHEENEGDLMSLTGQDRDNNIITRTLNRLVLSFYHKYIGHRLHDPLSVVEAWAGNGERPPVYFYQDRHITGAVTALTTILASALPGISALGLFLIEDQLVRMIAIIIFTLVFSTTITVVANARRVDCFAATAAFAAVLCVFVGSSNDCASR